ncbi:hypothetical protein C3495_04180 [Clostridiaceae bacterium 14S0207]|nr:hypothetical protein C3495_04180 [Clostridiaceae bacterium 14S0207]
MAITKKNLKEFLLMNVGLILAAAGVYFFLNTHDLAVGGVTGLAMVLSKYFPVITMGQFTFILNTLLLILGFIFIGPKFGGKTIYASFAISIYLALLEKICPMNHPITEDLFIELLIGILLSAIGMAIVFEQGASTGGTDILAKILNKYAHMDIGKALLISDFIITLFAMVAFGPKKGMYALIGVIILGYTVDIVIDGLNICKKVEIVTNKGDEVKKFITNELDRGATVYTAKGGYTNQEKQVITCVFSKKEFIKLKNYLKEIDDTAFVITYDVHEILGNGFKNIHED